MINIFKKKAFGDVFSSIGSREPQPKASEAFTKFGDAHRQIDKFALSLLKTIKPMISDLNTYLSKAIPDTKLTIQKYADVKFEYLVSFFFFKLRNSLIRLSMGSI